MSTTMDKYPPGFRFYPTEEELISFYLLKKLQGDILQLNRVIPVVAVYELEPWQLPELSGELCHRDTEQWFFFVPRQEREALGRRPTRTTGSGYWKTTGSPTYVYSNNKVIGMKKAMVFYNGKAPCGKKTKWKMNEYLAIEEELPMQSTTLSIPRLRREVSLCRLYVVSGSMRAFDRRPLVITSNEPVAHQANNVNGVLTSSQNTTMVDKTSSQSSCTLKDPLENTAGNTNCDSINDNESLWGWEQFDWL